MNGSSVLKLFQLSNGDLLFFRSMSTASTKCVKLEFRSWGRVSEVREKESLSDVEFEKIFVF